MKATRYIFSREIYQEPMYIDRKRTVYSYAQCGDWEITETINLGTKYKWTLTHIPSSTYAAFFENLEIAIDAMEQIADLPLSAWWDEAELELKDVHKIELTAIADKLIPYLASGEAENNVLPTPS